MSCPPRLVSAALIAFACLFPPAAWCAVQKIPPEPLTPSSEMSRTAVDDGAWDELPPPIRFEHQAIYDPVRDRLIVFGGSSGSTATNDGRGRDSPSPVTG